MFESAFKRIARSTRDAYVKPEKTEICGVPVAYKNSSPGSNWDEWKPVLDEWLPRFEEHGWLDGLERIEIGSEMVNGDGVGEYRQKEQIIAFKDDAWFCGPPHLVATTKEYGLIHEMIHHVHISNLFDKPNEDISELHIAVKQEDVGWKGNAHKFNVHVSEYASTNFLEAVAEAGAGMMLGRKYPDSVRRAYKQFEGPEPFRNWEEPEEAPDHQEQFTYSGEMAHEMYTHKNVTLEDDEIRFHYDEGDLVLTEDGLTFEE